MSGAQIAPGIVSPVLVVASVGPAIEGVVIVAALVLLAILLRNP